MQAKLDENHLFQRMSEEDLTNDAAANLLTDATEEGQKVARNSGKVLSPHPSFRPMDIMACEMHERRH